MRALLKVLKPLIIFCLVACFVVSWSPAQETSKKEGAIVPPPFEILSQDASWCGPRLLYFFARLSGQDCTLDYVVSICKTDEAGHADLLSLVTAARELNLEPLAVECAPEQILSLNGPAILCFRRTAAVINDSGTSEVLHFVGLVGKKGDEYWIVDPSVDTAPYPADLDAVKHRFTGHVVLLRGCPRPSSWLASPYFSYPLWTAAFIFLWKDRTK